jgi:predicted DNA binding CopG/RHH family protein
MKQATDTGRPVTVRLTAKEVKRLDALAAKSGMTRHRYMSFVLDRAMSSGLVVKERVEYAESRPLKEAS